MVVIPEKEKWLHENKEALEAVQKGLEESARGEAKEVPEIDEWLEEED